MRALAAMLASLALLGAPTARGEEVRVWTDPLGRFTLNVDALGWTPIDTGNTPLEEGDVLLVEHNQLQAGGGMRMCAVRTIAVPNAPRGVSQAQANLAIQSRSQQQAERSTGAPLTSFTRTEMEGVAVANFTFERDGAKQFWRLFYLSHASQMYQVNLTCGASNPVSEAEAATINRLIDSLRILPRANQ